MPWASPAFSASARSMLATGPCQACSRRSRAPACANRQVCICSPPRHLDVASFTGMTVSLRALLAFCGWTLFLIGCLGVVRSLGIRQGKIRLSEIRAEKPQLTERHQRLVRAHANCTENL